MVGSFFFLHLLVSNNQPQFSQVEHYRPNNYSSPIVTLQNGTNTSGTHTIISTGANQSEINFDTPLSDSYQIKAYYIEYGISFPSYSSTGNLVANCPNSASNGCARWYKMLELPDGFRPECAALTVIISEKDPDGFIGNCN